MIYRPTWRALPMRCRRRPPLFGAGGESRIENGGFRRCIDLRLLELPAASGAGLVRAQLRIFSLQFGEIQKHLAVRAISRNFISNLCIIETADRTTRILI